AEQEKYSEPPRRNPEPAVDEPTEAGSDYHACNKFTRESETSRVAGCSRRPIRTRTIGGLVRTFVACKLFAEALESRGESGLIGLPLATVAVLARAVGHGFPHSRISVRGMSAPEPSGPMRCSGYSFGYIVPCLIEIDTCAAFQIGHFRAF